MFSIAKFNFEQNNYNHTLRLEVLENIKMDMKVFYDLKNEDKKVIVGRINKDATNEELLQLGENLAKEITDDFNIEYAGSDEIELKYLFENLLLGLTPINLFSSEYELPKEYRVSGEYSLEAAYIDGYNNALSYNIVRILNHLPHSECNPDSLVKLVSNLFISPEINVSILRKQECENLSLNGMLALSQASAYEPAVIKLEFKTDETQPHLAIVGKGITFDTGGYSLKTARDISNMKADMGGVSATIGTMHYLMTNHLKANVTAYLMVTDNMINERALIPGDVIKYANEISVEVANTDAEGRLILADGLLLAASEGAKRIIDIATLTGSAEAALGTEYAALFTNNQEFANKMLKVNSLSNDKVWQMPLVNEYKKSLKGNITDIRNISSLTFGGSITAALFLEHFVDKDTKWMHIDMAGQSERSEFGTKYSGYGVRLLTNFIQNK